MKKKYVFSSLTALLLTLVCVVPFLYVLFKSFLSTQGEFTLEYYYEVFLSESQYLIRFWKSLALGLIIALAQTAVSTLAGYGFAKCRFHGRDGTFFLLMVLMIMPLQVTLVPNYLMMEKLGMASVLNSIDLPASMLPVNNIFDWKYYSSQLSLVFGCLSDFGMTDFFLWMWNGLLQSFVEHRSRWI